MFKHKGWRPDRIYDVWGYWCLASPLLINHV